MGLLHQSNPGEMRDGPYHLSDYIPQNPSCPSTMMVEIAPGERYPVDRIRTPLERYQRIDDSIRWAWTSTAFVGKSEFLVWIGQGEDAWHLGHNWEI